MHKIFEKAAKQSEEDLSFCGGVPRIPEGTALPVCTLSGEPLTFFFQVAFPEGHAYASHSLAVFYNTGYADLERSLPRPAEEHHAGGFFDDYQSTFRVLIFKTDLGVPRAGYVAKVAFKRWELKAIKKKSVIGHVGGAPDFIQDEDAAYALTQEPSFTFLMQLKSDVDFETTDDAPGQMVPDLAGGQQESGASYYQLFFGNQTYFFGGSDPNDERTLIVLQSD